MKFERFSSILRSTVLLGVVSPIVACGARTEEKIVADASTFSDSSNQPDVQTPDGSADGMPPADAPVDPKCEPTINKQQCNESITYPCGVPFPKKDSGVYTQGECKVYCASAMSQGMEAFYCSVYRDAQGADVLSCASCAVGRRPDGLMDSTFDCNESCSELALYLARAAYLEAASVHSFERMYEELSYFGAPPEILLDVKQARLDEVAHATVVRHVAERHGGTVPNVQVRGESSAPRSVEAVALENAVEGCVRETYGVVLAMYQASHAAGADIREMYTVIAEDELRHAFLSWRVHEWLWPMLNTQAKEHVRTAQDEAISQLERELEVAAGYGLKQELGLPSPQEHKPMFTELQQVLWTASQMAPS